MNTLEFFLKNSATVFRFFSRFFSHFSTNFFSKRSSCTHKFVILLLLGVFPRLMHILISKQIFIDVSFDYSFHFSVDFWLVGRLDGWFVALLLNRLVGWLLYLLVV